MAMKPVRMVSETRFEYAGKMLIPGQEFDCEPHDVHVLRTIGHARLILNGTLLGQNYGTRVMTARRGKTIQ